MNSIVSSEERQVAATSRTDGTPTTLEATALPQRMERVLAGRRRRSMGAGFLFLLIVVLPTALFVLYALTTPSPLYRTEVSFAIRSAENNASGNLLGGLAASVGIGAGSSNDIYAIRSYLRSIESMRWLEQEVGFLQHASNPSLDFWTRLPADATTDDKLKYFKSFVIVEVSIMEQILTIKTWAYDPEMARDMSMTLIDAAETFINSLNTRAERDIVRFAEAELNAARDLVRDSRIAMTDWRTALEEVDPVQTAEAQLRQIALLEGELSQIRADIIRLQTNNVSGPRMQEVRSRETALEEQIRRERRRIFEERTGTAGRMSEYERLVVESEIAAKQYQAAYEALAVARQEAARQQKYLVVTAPPPVPENRAFPRLGYHVPVTFAIAFVIFLIARFLVALSRDYRAVH